MPAKDSFVGTFLFINQKFASMDKDTTATLAMNDIDDQTDKHNLENNKILICIGKLLSLLCGLALQISKISLILMTVIIGWQVFGRYVLNSSPSWSETTSISLMGWFVLVGAGAGVRNRDHLGFNIGLMLMKPKMQKWVCVFGDFVVMLFGIAMVVYGMRLIIDAWSNIHPGSFFNQGVHYFPLAVGGVLIAVFSLEKIFGLLVLKKEVQIWNS